MNYDINFIRDQFPALARKVNGHPAVYFDGPGGTQTPQRVIDSVSGYLAHRNSNTHGAFVVSAETDETIMNARQVFADFFNCSWDEVAFGENSTTLNFKLSQAIARDLVPGDEVLITDIDHDANRSPWLLLTERGITVRSVAVDSNTLALDMSDLKKKLTGRTKVVAFNGASNAVGTISDAKEIVKLAHAVGAVTVIDAVHLALHGVLDVKNIGVDYLFCSAYKFFGPHIGVLYARREVLKKLRTLKVSAQDDAVPYKIETGTMNHEGIAGAAEAVEFIAELGRRSAGGTSRRERIVNGMQAAEEHERPLAEYFKEELKKIDGLTLYAPPAGIPCTSTISFRLKNMAPKAVATALAEKGIFVWAGSFYAVRLMEVLGLSKNGGMVRIGLAPYNTREEVERAIKEIKRIARES